MLKGKGISGLQGDEQLEIRAVIRSGKGKQSERNMEGSDMDEKKMEFGFDERANCLNGGRL